MPLGAPGKAAGTAIRKPGDLPSAVVTRKHIGRGVLMGEQIVPPAGRFAFAVTETCKGDQPMYPTARPATQRRAGKAKFAVKLCNAQTRSTIILGVALGVAQPALGQQTKPKTLDPIFLEAQADDQPSLLYGKSDAGSRVGLTSLETPASVEVIGGQTIRDRGQRNVEQAITQNGTGITFRGSPGNGGTALAMRGFSGHGSVTRLYDGTRLYPGSGSLTFPSDTWSVQRIEVLHGPSAVLYGEGGIGGAVNIVPKRPLTDRTENEIRLTAGSDGLFGLALGSAGPINDQLAYSLYVNHEKSDGWIDRGETSQFAVSAGLQWQATDDLTISVLHDQANSRPLAYFGTPLVNGSLDERVRRRNYNIEDARTHYRDRLTQLRAEWSISDSVTLTNTTYVLSSNRDWRNVENYTYQPNTGDVLREWYIAVNHDQDQRGNRTELRFESAPWGMQNTTTIGADINRIRFRNSNNSPYPGSSVVDFPNPEPGSFGPYTMATRLDTTTDQYSIFADNRLKINDRWSVVAGLRYDNISVERVDPNYTVDLDSLNWRVGAVFNPIPTTAIYGQFSRAAEPLGNILTASSSHADYDMTTGRQAEIGIKSLFWEGRGEATLAAYRIVKKNMLARDPNDPTQTVQIGRQSSKGIEASVALALSDSLRLDANAAFVSPRYDNYIQGSSDLSGNQPGNVPRRVANLALSWDVAPAWTLRSSLHHVGEVYTSDRNTDKRGSYTVLNAGVRWQLRDNAALDLNINNLTDKTYATSGGSSMWLLGAPRNATLALNMKF